MAEDGTADTTTEYTLSSLTGSIKYHYNGSDYTTVPGSPYSSSSSPNWNHNDYIYIALLPTNQAPLTGDIFAGSVTIDVSKILEDYTGIWNIKITTDDISRININNYNFEHIDNGEDTYYRMITLSQKYINIEHVTYSYG